MSALTPAEERAAREGLPVVLLIPFDCINVAQGHPMIVRTVNSGEALVRLYTADELLAANDRALAAIGEENVGVPPMTREQAEDLTRPIGGAR